MINDYLFILFNIFLIPLISFKLTITKLYTKKFKFINK